MDQLIDGKFYGGAEPDPIDKDAPKYEDKIGLQAEKDINWGVGFDIRDTLGDDITKKNQFRSLSCVGQAWAYYNWVLNILELIKKYGMSLKELKQAHPEEVEEASAKAIYSQIHLSGGGAWLIDGAKLICNWGSVTEKVVKSYMSDGTTDEPFMRDTMWKTKQVDGIAKVLQGKEPRVIQASYNIDLMARAIMENSGVVGGVTGSNGHGWGYSEFVTPPVEGELTWGHALYFGAFGKDEKGKYIATPNSWGDFINKKWEPGKPPGYGWQKVYENYFVNNGQWVFNPWTYTDKLNFNLSDMENDFVRIVKDEGSAAVGFFIPATSPEALKTMSLAFKKDIVYNADGTINWPETIEGKVTLEEPLTK